MTPFEQVCGSLAAAIILAVHLWIRWDAKQAQLRRDLEAEILNHQIQAHLRHHTWK